MTAVDIFDAVDQPESAGEQPALKYGLQIITPPGPTSFMSSALSPVF